MQFLTASQRNDDIHPRQIAFFCAFILPLSKFVEAPSLLAKSAMGAVSFYRANRRSTKFHNISPLNERKRPFRKFLITLFFIFNPYI